jgi:hypothetical protein
VNEIKCEAELDWRDWGTVPIRSADFITWRPAPLPAELVAACAVLERSGDGGDLAVACTDQIARRLTDTMWMRVRELAAASRIPWALPSDVAELGRALSPFAVAQIIRRVVSDGLEYDPVAEGLERPSLLKRASYKMRRLVNVHTVSAIRVADDAANRRRPLVVCREFAMAMRALFYALKRATGAPANAYMPAISGHAIEMETRGGEHAWNWIVDAERGTINAIDATGTCDVPLARYRNVSAFLNSMYDSIGAANATDFDIATLLRAMIDPETYAGQLRLLHLAEHLTIPLEVRARVTRHFHATNFERLVPGWRDRLARVDASLGRLDRFLFSLGGTDALRTLELLGLHA